MSVTGLRIRSIGGGSGHSIGMVLAFGLGLTACGPKFSSERAELKSDGTMAQTYQEWCTDWQLSCPVTDPGKADPLTKDQFKALSTILSSALASPSVFSITREDLDAEGLKQAMTALHLDDVYQDVQARLEASQWQSGGLENGALVSRNAASSSQRSESGLLLNLDTVQKVALATGEIQMSGLGWSADAAKEAPGLQSMAVASDGTFGLGMSDRMVNQVPQAFALDNLLLAFGLDTGKLEGKEIALPDLITAGAPLVGWLNQSSRQIALDRVFFATTAGQLPALIPEDNLGQSLGNLLNSFDKLRTSSAPGSNLAAVSLLKGKTAKCDMNSGEIKVEFSSEFGVKRIYQPNPTTLGLEFYGLKASAKKALGIGIKLKRIELTSEKITILDVPIIGKVELKLDEVSNPDQKTTLVCGA